MANCKVCGSPVRQFMSFGKMPLGNAFLRKNQFNGEERFDLDLGFCPSCTLVQQTKPPPVKNLAKDYTNYRYIPVGGSLRDNLANLGKSIVEDFRLQKDSLVVDIGSNDGTLLSAIKDRCSVLGVEPAVEISRIARNAGVETITAFFDRGVAGKIVSTKGCADAIVTTQTLQHIPDVNRFVENVSRMLKPNAAFVIEGRYLADTIRNGSFDAVYHEMLYFFALRSLSYLLAKAGLQVLRAEATQAYGGSLRVYSRKSQPGKAEVSEPVKRMLASERRLGLAKYDTYVRFARRSKSIANRLNKLLEGLRRKEQSVAAYGAPSTSSTLLHFCRIGREHLRYVVDDSPLKQGLFTPGTHIPIVDSSALGKDTPDYLLLLAWRLKDEILPKTERFTRAGMSVIVPLPKLHILRGGRTTIPSGA